MGDYAEAILDGCVCSSCGEYLDGKAGFGPALCSGCDADEVIPMPEQMPSKVRRQRMKRKWRGK